MRSFIVVAVAVLWCSPVAAQLNVEVRGGLAIGSHSATYAALELVPSLTGDVLASWQFRDALLLFAGATRTSFGCDDGLCHGKVLITGLHGIVGAEYRWRMLWGRMGGMFGQLAIGTVLNRGLLSTPRLATRSWGPGVYGAMGARLSLPFLSRAEVVPGFSYRWMSGGGRAVCLTGDLGFSIPITKGAVK